MNNIMLKKIISKKNIIMALVCCLIFWMLLNSVPNKMSYTVEEGDDSYIVSVFNPHGEKIYEEQYRVEPVISKVGKDTVMITVGKGDWHQSKFINGKTGRISEWFDDVKECSEQLVVNCVYKDNRFKIIIRDIYDKDKTYKEITDSFSEAAVGKYLVKDIEIINDHLVYLRYYIGDDWEEKGRLIFLN